MKASGFTYFTVMMVVVIMGAGLAAIGTVWHQAARREKERELLFVGGEFRRAIGRYFEGSPGGPQFPKSLDDLLLDKRLPVVSRHLRKVYVDPMTGTRDWGLVKDPAGAIVGVYSKAEGKPLKSAKFNEEDKAFDAAIAYSDWKFVYGSGTLAAAPTGITSGIQNVGSPATGGADDEVRAVPIAPPTDTTSAREDPAREARRPGCEKQREKDNAACAATGPVGMQNPAAIGCAASAAGRFNACLDGTAPAAPAASPG
ncbi:MAG: type II secretion system protein [Burkholderiales bacterium]